MASFMFQIPRYSLNRKLGKPQYSYGHNSKGKILHLLGNELSLFSK
jgi:hypothetical protein